jgi:hypothetical protein
MVGFLGYSLKHHPDVGVFKLKRLDDALLGET